jgi:two-component system sensor histidine kinase UhpB
MLSLKALDLQSLDHSQLFLCCITDPQLQFIHTNQLFRQTFDLQEEAYSGLSWLNITRPANREKCIAAIKACLQSPGKPVQVEAWVYRPAKEEQWFQWEISAVTGDDQAVQGICFIGTDISSRKSVGRQLEKTKEEYFSSEAERNTFMNALAEGVVVMNEKTEIIEFNTAAEKILGVSPGGMSSLDTRWKCIHEDGSDFPGHEHPSVVALQTGNPQHNVIIGLYRPDDTLVWICSNAQPVFRPGGNGRPTEVVCSFLDITQMKQAERALRESESRWKFALEGAGDGVWEYHVPSGEVYYSDIYKKMLGYSDHEFKNNLVEWRMKIHPDDLPAVETIEKNYDSGLADHHSVEYRIRNKSGEYTWVLDRGMVIERSPEGTPLKIIGTNKNITERKINEEKLKNNERRVVEAIIEAQERERQEISYELHDNVNQLLSTGMLVLSVAENYPEHTTEYIAQSKDAVQRAIDEIRRITHTLNPATLDFVGLTASIEDVMKEINITGRLHISFIQEGINENKLASSVQLAIFRIIQEQLTNIIKHSGASNAIIKLVQDPDKIQLEVRDNGSGFDMPTTRMGLGLNNIFTRVEHYNGVATLETRPGDGCLLKAVLPAELG